jgi:ABC-2 type transport system ATP-binding protein
VEVGGRGVAEDPIGIRARIGYMPEHDCLPLDQSAADVVATLGELAGLPARAARQRASDMLDLVGLDEARFRAVGTYSTGMRQRTKLAQALVADPEVVLLDEPTSGLDPSGRDEMLDLVARLGADEMSVVMSTHVLADVQRACDHVVMLDAGRLVMAGGTEDLLDTTGTILVEVDGPVEALVTALTARGLACAVAGSRVEVTAPDAEAGLDAIRDEVSELGLPLNSLATRLTSLDEVFVRRAPP